MSSRPFGIILKFEMYAVDGPGEEAAWTAGARAPSLSKLIITNKTVL